MKPQLSPYAQGFDAGVKACQEVVARATITVPKEQNSAWGWYASGGAAALELIQDDLAALRMDAPEPEGASDAKDGGRE